MGVRGIWPNLALSLLAHALLLAWLIGSQRFSFRENSTRAGLRVSLEAADRPSAKRAAPVAHPVRPSSGISHQKTSPAAEPVAEGGPRGDPKAVANFESELRAAIEREKQYPSIALARRQQGHLVVGFTLTKRGNFEDIHLVEASPFEALNEAALDALRRLGHFRPIPDSVSPGDWKIVLPIDYRLN